ncbi:hypothetical protein V5799_001033 [Amblyomma americanum]|uniref:Uncharacterized protein n=1 Tax=Amblyomma americanum TaxID=6943 RepID=A0AAQ4D1C5_AMBAM
MQEKESRNLLPLRSGHFRKAGLTLTLDLQPFEYLPTSTSMGFLVMVHGHGFRADVCQDSVFAQPGYVTYIGLRQWHEVSSYGKFFVPPQDIHNNQTGPQKRLLAQVVVYFKTLTFENVASVPKYDLDRVHSSFCGINGMCLGVSCLMFFSMLDACVQALWSYCRTRHQRHRQLSAATSTSSSYQE